jgi:acetylcholinesterase
MKGLYFLFLKPTSRKRSIFSPSVISLITNTCRTESELHTYLKEFVLPATDAQIDELLTLYPQNPTLGSPYDTGTQNALTPQFKRMASILGDFVFQGPRRFFLQTVSDKQKVWSFCTLHMPSPALDLDLHSFPSILTQ